MGRTSLRNTLLSFSDYLTDDDAVIVLSDGPDKATRDFVMSYALDSPAEWVYHEVDPPLGDWGHPLRNVAMDNFVETSHVWTIDDDDVAADGALDILRAHMDDPFTVFKMTFGPGHFASGITCWRWEKLSYGDIGTPMVFAPFSEARWGHSYGGDWDYVEKLRELFGEPVFSDEIIAHIRPLRDIPSDGTDTG